MGSVRFTIDDVVNVRFAVSPLWETLAGFRAAADPGAHAAHLPWLRTAAPLHRDPVLAARTASLRALLRPARAAARPAAQHGPPSGLPGFLTPPPRCPLTELDHELAVVRATPPGRVEADLLALGAPAADPAAATAALAQAVSAWWEAAIEPHWPRIRAVLEADIAHRTRQLAEDGIQRVFDHLHPGVHWAADTLTSPDLPAGGTAPAGTGITLTPSVFATRCHLLDGAGPTPPAVIYPARAAATAWQSRPPGGGELARLLGASRALLLAGTTSPSTTTQLAQRTGLSLGTVSQHLAVLRDAGLVSSHRYRREVSYTTTDLGTALLNGPADTSG
ncbi:DUF5937 family protein [Actinomadura roseirufa]|uniref:DUF5937 family protein n=1 Tax=Actinomadura roseirufa TaxID=2094049 RepID=UPI00104151B2|nr:DUF5937 family protein [Actinomadura roseirufa]